jgi:hypothetical protein
MFLNFDKQSATNIKLIKNHEDAPRIPSFYLHLSAKVSLLEASLCGADNAKTADVNDCLLSERTVSWTACHCYYLSSFPATNKDVKERVSYQHYRSA